MAIVFAVQKWRHYLLGTHFIIRTDQKYLKHLLEQREVQPTVAKWLVKLLGFDFEIQYKPGLENKAADALSRMDHSAYLQTIVVTSKIDVAQITKELYRDPKYAEILKKIQQDLSPQPPYTVHRGSLLYKGRLVVSKTSPMIPTLLQTFHDSVLGGHAGILRTYKRMARELFWVGMKADVKRYVESCHVCQYNKSEALSPAGLLQPLPIPHHIWEDILMDFIEGLPRSDRYNVILVVVDRLSKYAHFLPLSHPFTAPAVALLFVREIVRLHGFPKSIVSDRDKVFVSHFWNELFRLQGTRLNRSTAFHPQTDGQTERDRKSVV